MTVQAKVGVVLLNWNSGDFTISCIESLLAMTYSPWRVVVFDNGSTDGSCDEIGHKFPQIFLMQNDKNVGFARGNNIGIQKLLAEGADYIWVLNNDTVVEPTCLEQLMIAAKSDRRIAAVGAKILYADPPHTIWYAGARLNPFMFSAPHDGVGKAVTFGPKKIVQVDFVTGCSMLIPRHALAQVGLFDEKFFAYDEDFDWCLRVRQHGLRLVYAPQAVLYHKVSASMRRNTLGQSKGSASSVAYYLITRNFFWVVHKHAKPWQTITAILIRMILISYLSAGMIILWRWEKLFALWHGVRDGLAAWAVRPV